jgi:hypothetical protein
VPRLCLRCRRLGARPWEWSGRVAPVGRPGWSKVRYWWTQLLGGRRAGAGGVGGPLLAAVAVHLGDPGWSRAVGTMAWAFEPQWATQCPCQRFARDCATRNLTPPHDTTFDSAAHLAVVGTRRVLHGSVNRPRIDGKDGVGGSIPPGGSTHRLTSGNAGRCGVRGDAWGPESTSHVGKRSDPPVARRWLSAVATRVVGLLAGVLHLDHSAPQRFKNASLDASMESYVGRHSARRRCQSSVACSARIRCWACCWRQGRKVTCWALAWERCIGPGRGRGGSPAAGSWPG